MMNSGYRHTIKILSMALAVGVSLFIGQETTTEASLINQAVTIDFSQSGLAATDVITVGTGQEITFGNGTNIGDSGILFSDEFLDIGEASIVLQIQGLPEPNGTATTAKSHYQSNAQFSFTNLVWGEAPGKITGVNIILNNVTGVALNSEVFFTDNSLTLNVGTLHIGLLPDPIGQITLNLLVEHGNSNPIPEPSTIFLIGTGLWGLTTWRFCQKRRI